MASFGEGDAGKDLIWVIGIVLVLGVIWIMMGGPVSFKSGKTSNFFSIPNIIPESKITTNFDNKGKIIPSQSTSAVQATATNPNESIYKGQVQITLGKGGESLTTTDQEYVTLTASTRNKLPVNITGWKIDNGKSAKYYDSYGRIVQGKSTQVTIPLGTNLMNGITNSRLVPILLSPGGKAYVITGKMPNQTPYRVDASFKSNKCTGYLEALPYYKFTPSLSLSCPSYKEETKGIPMSDSCLSIVNDYGTNCHTPVISKDVVRGELVDKRYIPTDCKKIVLSKFNYLSCVVRHVNDADFYRKDWRVYLNHSGFPLYAKNRATITLYDSLGKIVDTYSY